LEGAEKSGLNIYDDLAVHERIGLSTGPPAGRIGRDKCIVFSNVSLIVSLKALTSKPFGSGSQITVTVHLIDSTRLPEPTAWPGIAYQVHCHRILQGLLLVSRTRRSVLNAAPQSRDPCQVHCHRNECHRNEVHYHRNPARSPQFRSCSQDGGHDPPYRPASIHLTRCDGRLPRRPWTEIEHGSSIREAAELLRD
jgi:hypothetical protein